MGFEKTKKDLIREQAEGDFLSFIRLVQPGRVLGPVHLEWIEWCTRAEARSHQLTLLPRDHQKSALIALRGTWEITRNPAIRILYISATSKLAIKQLKFMKDILTSPRYRAYWPEMVKEREGEREKWTETEISIDHPKRKAEYIRDPTIFTAGLSTTIAGLHCDINILDDIVEPENAYTQEGRESVERAYSYFASIEGTDARQWAVGTRYHPTDLYSRMMEMKVEMFDETGQLISEEPLYEKFERAVEDVGDGTGTFVWPRQQREDGKWFGFDQSVLAKKKAAYLDLTQFRAQYYNNPNSMGDGGVKREHFQYYEKQFVVRTGGYWYYKNNRLNVFAAIDFAYSLNKQADYSTIAVVGVDAFRNFYILDLDRFKTNDIGQYFQHMLTMHQKWGFHKIRAEVNAGQEAIVNEIKLSYIRTYGLSLSIDEYRPVRGDGNKEERIFSTLQPRYSNRAMWHSQGGLTNLLEEELLQEKPAHDDIKDALHMAVALASPYAPTALSRPRTNVVKFHGRFGGVI